MTKELVIFAVVNLLAATLSGASGGGGGLIATPFMVLMGLSPSAAIATAKFGLIGLVTSSVGGYAGAHIAVSRGNRFIINMFAAVSALLALQLLFG